MKTKKALSYIVLSIYLSFITLGGLVSISSTNAENFNFVKPELFNSEAGNQKVKIDDTQKDTIYVDKDGNEITDEKKIKELLTQKTVVNNLKKVILPDIVTNVNFNGFVTPTKSDGTKVAPLLYSYLYKQGLKKYTNIKPYNFYYDGYYYFLRNNGNFSYETPSLDLSKENKTKFIQKFRAHDLGDKTSTETINLKFLGKTVSFNIDDENSTFKYNGKEISRNAYFNNEGMLVLPNIFNAKYGFADDTIPQNLEIRATTTNNGNGTSNLNIELGKQINKNVIVWNGPGSEYDLVFREHMGNKLSKTYWYGTTGFLYNKYTYDKFSTSLGDYTVDSINSVPDYDVPRMFAKLVPQFSSWTDYYLPIEIYNGIIIMDVFPTYNGQHFGIVSTKNAQRRFNLIMGWNNNSVQKSENGDWQAMCPGMLDHGYNEWYRLVYDIQTKNGKQYIKLVTYWYNRDGTSGHVWVKNGECTTTFNSDYSGWKPNVFNHKTYKSMGLGQIIVIPKDDIWKIGHPGWTISTYSNIASNHPNNISEFISDLNNSANRSSKNFKGQTTYMLPMMASNNIRLSTNGKIADFGSGNGADLNQKNADNYFMNVIRGYFYAKQDGKYCFGVDGDDYVGIYLDGKAVAEWTGGHGSAKKQGGNRQGCINLTKGFHNFVALHEEMRGGDNFIFWVKNPWDSDYHVISPEKGEIYSTIFTDNGNDYKTVDTYYHLEIKGIKNQPLYYQVENNKNILLNGIKYFGVSEKLLTDSDIVNYAYDLLLNKQTSIYNDDLSQDINSYNAEFWLKNKNILDYNLISSIDRIGGIRNFGIIAGKDSAGPYNVSDRSKIPQDYYSEERNKPGGYDIDTSWLYNKGLGFSPLGLKWRRNTLQGYILYSDLKNYGNYDKIAIINNVSSYTYSGDNDYAAGLYSNGKDIKDWKDWIKTKSLERIDSASNSTNRSKENTIVEHYTKKSLTFPDGREFKLNHTYIYNPALKKITQNDRMGYFGTDLVNIDYNLGGDIWAFTNDADNDTKYGRIRSYYNEFKVYNLTFSPNF